MFTLAKFTNGRGSSSAWVRRFLLPRGRRTCFHCSAASGLMSPTVCCCRCWERPLPESLFSSTHPSKTTKKPHKQATSASWPAQVLSWIMTSGTNLEQLQRKSHSVGFIYPFVFLKQNTEGPVELFGSQRWRTGVKFQPWRWNMRELKNTVRAQTGSPE